MKGNTAIAALRCFCCLVMAVGLVSTIYSVMYRVTIPLFAFDVPSWMIGVSAAYMGLRHYRRIPELEQKITPNATFSWARLSPFRTR